MLAIRSGADASRCRPPAAPRRPASRSASPTSAPRWRSGSACPRRTRAAGPSRRSSTERRGGGRWANVYDFAHQPCRRTSAASSRRSSPSCSAPPSGSACCGSIRCRGSAATRAGGACRRWPGCPAGRTSPAPPAAIRSTCSSWCPVALLHAIGSPSFALLRLVPAVANLLALVAGFFFARRLYGETTAWIHTVALAVLPTAIAHSRICQDPSQSVFWTGLVVYLALLGVKDRGAAWRWFAGALVAVPGGPLDAPDQRLRRALSPPADRGGARRADAGLAAGTDRPRHRDGVRARGRPDRGLARVRERRACVSLAGQALAVAGGGAPRRWRPMARIRREQRAPVQRHHRLSTISPARGRGRFRTTPASMLAAVLVLGGFVLAASAPAVAARRRPHRRLRRHLAPLLRLRRAAGAASARRTLGPLSPRAGVTGARTRRRRLDRARAAAAMGRRSARRRSPPRRCSARSTSTTSVRSPPPAGNRT